jgi:hypothetical protein
MLGPADRIVVQVAPNGKRTTLDAAHLAALDVVYDAATPAVLAQRIRRAIPGLRPGPLAMRTNPAWPAGVHAFGEAATHAAALQRMLVRAQPALPPAFARPGEKPARHVLGPDVAELKTRVTAASNALAAATAQLANALAATPVRPGQLAGAVGRLAAFGIAIPGAPPTDPTAAAAVLGEARRRRDAAVAALGATPFGAADGIAAGKAVFGDAFWALPIVSAGPADLYGAVLGRVDPGQAKIRRFLRDVGSVRNSLAAYTEAMLLGDALGVSRQLHIAQLAPSGTPGTKRWLGLPFDETEPSPDVPVASIVVDGPPGLAAGDRVSGLVVDEWLEVVPQRVEHSDGAGGTVRDAVVTAGLAVNAATPDARAPQALLLAVSPDGRRWTTDVLADVLRETLELAKLRTVTLERALWAGRVLPALYEQSWSLQGEQSLDILTLATTIGTVDKMLPFIKELK